MPLENPRQVLEAPVAPVEPVGPVAPDALINRLTVFNFESKSNSFFIAISSVSRTLLLIFRTSCNEAPGPVMPGKVPNVNCIFSPQTKYHNSHYHSMMRNKLMFVLIFLNIIKADCKVLLTHLRFLLLTALTKLLLY
ncbi:hypothetical protein COF09_31420 [Bacillus toyonensis]|nr:hypothetical protein COF09_31420 [Bacillus toyonensis]